MWSEWNGLGDGGVCANGAAGARRGCGGVRVVGAGSSGRIVGMGGGCFPRRA